MGYLVKGKEEIRKYWFENHVVKKIEGKDGFQRIIWGEEGTSMYQIEYVLSGSEVFISGDLGEAVYCLTCAATLENIKDFNFSYFTGKLRAFCEDRWDFNPEQAKQELDKYWEEYEMELQEDSQDIYDGVLSAIEESSSMEGYRGWLMTVYNEHSVDTDLLEVIWDFGQKMPLRLIGYWVGLQMIIEQLEKDNEKVS